LDLKKKNALGSLEARTTEEQDEITIELVG
jgi:hypothetical protein